MRRIGAALDWTYLQLARLAAAAMVLMVLIMLANIASRVFGVFLADATVIAGYTLVTVTFFALPHALRTGAHIRVTLVLASLPAGGRRWADVFCWTALVVIALALAWFLYRLVYFSYIFDDMSDGVMRIPLWIPQTPMAVGAAFFAVAAIHSLFEAVGHALDPSRAPAGAAQEEAAP